MARVVADAGVPWVLMHWRGHSRDMAAAAVYRDPVAEVRQELLDRVDDALAAGVAAEQIVLDPGFGFAKELPHDLALLAHLDVFVGLGFPLLVGTSRKRFLGRVLTGGEERVPTPAERDTATLATSVLAAQAGAWAVRVHAVAATVDAVRVVAAVRGAAGPPSS
jgi:dihydropteroate synthase